LVSVARFMRAPRPRQAQGPEHSVM
jgi:hypothetical protein